MKKLYYAKLKIDVCYLSENSGSEYAEILNKEFDNNKKFYLDSVEVKEIVSEKDIPVDWQKCIIYGTEDESKDFTPESYLESLNEEKAKEKLRKYLFDNGNESIKEKILYDLIRWNDNLPEFIKSLEKH